MNWALTCKRKGEGGGGGGRKNKNNFIPSQMQFRYILV